MDPLPPTAALIIIDVQQGFDDPVWGQRNNPQAEANIARLLDAWRRTNRPVFFVQHDSSRAESPLRPGQPGHDIKPEVQPQPGELVIHKRVHSAFIGTDLDERLRAAGSDTVVITGLTTMHCVSTTARMAHNTGFTTLLVSDATAAFPRTAPDGTRYDAATVHNVALAELHEEFVTALETDAVLQLAE